MTNLNKLDQKRYSLQQELQILEKRYPMYYAKVSEKKDLKIKIKNLEDQIKAIIERK